MRNLAFLLASLFIVTSGCVISPRRNVSGTGSGGGNSEFSVSANPASQVITAGGSATYAISVSAINGFTGTVSLHASSSNTNITASFDNTTITGGSGSATLTVSTATTATSGNVTITVTASDTANNISQNVSVNASIQSAASTVISMNAIERAASQTGCVNTPPTATAQRVSLPVSPATTGFTATFSATPSSSSMDAALGFFAPASSQQPALSSLINFSPGGVIQVRNGDSFASSTVQYVAGETLQFRLVENLPATTYSLFVTPPAAAEVPLATDLLVPSDQRGTTTLGGWGQLVNAPNGATLSVCNFSLR
ncbi:MAG TPA: hypothetical protein VLA83_09030 [Candidatus Binatia bacterium]|nr:hypothetical protein [Candidatus Binatia bacterium]